MIAWTLIIVTAGTFRSPALVQDPVLDYFLLVVCSLAGFSAVENGVDFFSLRQRKRATGVSRTAPPPPPVENESDQDPRHRGRDFTVIK